MLSVVRFHLEKDVSKRPKAKCSSLAGKKEKARKPSMLGSNNPLLEQLCDWYNFVTSPAGLRDPFSESIHFQTPFGLWNSLRDGSGTTDYDELLLNNSSVGLERATSLFLELV